MARLRIEFRGAETVVSLRDRETTVGRSNKATIHLPDPSLAPVHFRIRQRDKGYQLKDDGSGAGTRVNGKPVFATTLRHGDAIEAGALRCVFLAEADAPVPAAPGPVYADLAAPEEDEAPAPPLHPPRGRAWMAWAVAGAAACLLVVYLVLRTPPDKEAKARWLEAAAVRDAALTDPDRAEVHLEKAAGLMQEIVERYGSTPTARIAASNLEEVRRVLDALKRVAAEQAAATGERTEKEIQEAFVRLGRIGEVVHPVVAERIANAEQLLKLSRSARNERRLAEARDEAEKHMRARAFGDALRVWTGFQVPDYLYRQRAEDERRDLEKRIGEEYRGLLRLAGRNEDLDGRIALLEASRPVFRGTDHAEDLEVRISALRARRTQPPVVVVKEKPPEQTTPPGETTPPPPPVEAGPYEEPPQVAALVKQRRYAEAAALLHSISKHPDAKVRVEELTLLANLMADLVGAVHARPGEFTGVLLPSGAGRGDAVDADDKLLTVKVDGAETRYAWDQIPAKSFVKIFRQAGFEQPPRLATALFFDEEALPKEAQRDYVAFFRSDQDTDLVVRVLSRRRGIEPPVDGFEIFRGDLVTKADKERTLRLEHIEDLGKQARSTLDKRRREAWAELEAMGVEAAETLAAVLKERRAQVAAELEKSGAFSPGRFASRLGRDLTAAREAALAFILDANKYPYPNKSEEAQKEAERLVDAVRDIYEHPYPRLLESSDEAKALDAELVELDERLARVDPLSEPLRDATVEKITKGLDTRVIALDNSDRKRIDYNLAVEKYNREVPTSADEEERANVAAVNEYRHMMGLNAVKIDERLVRAARKHSIEMRQLGYFEHNSPTPSLRTPGQRCQREGYPGGVSENIALGASTGVQVFWQWFKSSGHHRNMLIPRHTDLGCGAAQHHWWTQNFGSASGRSLDFPKVPPDPDPPGQSGNGRPAPGE